MSRYLIGRFLVEIPVEMKQAVQSQKIRYAKIRDFEWDGNLDRNSARSHLWAAHIASIRNLEKPANVKSVVLEERLFPRLGNWAKGVLYLGDYIIQKRHFWDVLVDYGRAGVWLTIDGTNDEMSLKNIQNILSHYRTDIPPHSEAFYLRYGAVDLPYMEQERSYARFENGAANTKLEVEMNETRTPQKIGIGERLAASIATRFAPGVHVKKLRSRQREIAGLRGEELVIQMSASGEETEIHFCWEFLGRPDSGRHPEISITMESPEGDVDEKMKIWDSVLDSFKPVYQ